MDDSTFSEESRALIAAGRTERLALGFLCVMVLFGGLGIEIALESAGHPRLAEIFSQGLFWGVLGYTYVRWTGYAAPRGALATASVLFVWQAVWVLGARPASLAVWHWLIR